MEGINGVIAFLLLSLACVAGCCIVPIVKPNPHYFFMYYALSVTCAVSLLTKGVHMRDNPQLSRVCSFAFAVVALLGISWNFIPYIHANRCSSKQLSSYTQQLIDEGVQTILVHYQDAPIFAAASNDSIIAGIYKFDDLESSMISPLPYLQDRKIFSAAHSRKTLLCLTENTFNLMPAIAKDKLYPLLEKHSEIEINSIKYYLFFY